MPNLFTKSWITCSVYFLTSLIRGVNERKSIAWSQLLQIRSREHVTSFSLVKNLTYLQADKEKISTLLHKMCISRYCRPFSLTLPAAMQICIGTKRDSLHQKIVLFLQHWSYTPTWPHRQWLGSCVLESFLGVNGSQVFFEGGDDVGFL